MTTNGEWLFSKPFDEQVAWMNAERTESPTSETMQHIGQVIENTVKRGVYGDTEPENDDSRDKLEADVRKIAEAYNMDTQRHGTERFAHELYYSIIHLLDRQAVITERKLDAEFEAACNSCATKIDLREEVDKLTAERDELQEQLLIGWECECRLQAERELYRSKFGKCLDYADAIHALMDDEGMA